MRVRRLPWDQNEPVFGPESGMSPFHWLIWPLMGF